ncbi:LacI family DNA-binding transcriptional regulator [Saccharopolyspora spinosa]|uniref:LacI family transcriptional regulator n=1 Tax=Saccharopolyspora spinosa TaxID=60894 RepID=A0A2N3Y5V6_SACSN|nr:LacI family DNA-binding transcriptional regulator [Saccharopolyspora spinosa]PKW18309.1 LacI family transcriptional regulator [Saccharopolyspora spinosa]
MLEAVDELGYGADPHARSLRTGRSGINGLILRPRDAVHGSLAGSQTFNRLAGAIATTVLERNLGLIHVPDMLDPAGQRVPMDGCIVAHPYGDDKVLGELMRRNVPVVTVDEDPDRPDFAWSVTLGHRAAVTGLLDRLRAEGARRVMLLTGTEDNAWNCRSTEAYRAWARKHRMRPQQHALYEGEGVDGAVRFIAPILAGNRPPDAIVAAASRFASGAAQAAEMAGMNVPDDLMVASLTDSEFTRANNPPITAVDLVLEELALRAVDLLLGRLKGQPALAVPLVLQPELRWRQSTTRNR